MAEIDIYELAEQAKQRGCTTKQHVLERLEKIIIRQQSYLAYRASRGRHTSHDDITEEDNTIIALAMEMLLETKP